MKKFKIILESILYIVLFLMINFGVILLFTLGFNLITNSEINSPEYVLLLVEALDKYKILITIITGLIIIPCFYKIIKKLKVKNNFIMRKHYIYYILIGISSSIVLNIMIYYLTPKTNINNVSSLTLQSLISVGIIGPIIEEFMFRGIVFNKLNKVFSTKKTIFISSLLFAFYHLNIIQGIYAFLLSLIITYYYSKDSNLFVPTLIHISANSVICILFPMIIKLSNVYILLILVFLIFINLFSILKLKKIDTSKQVS